MVGTRTVTLIQHLLRLSSQSFSLSNQRLRQIKRLWNNLIKILALTIEYLVNKPYTFLGIFLVHNRFGHCWLRVRLLLHLTRSLDDVKAPINKKRRHWTVRCLGKMCLVFNCLKSLPIDRGNILDTKRILSKREIQQGLRCCRKLSAICQQNSDAS